MLIPETHIRVGMVDRREVVDLMIRHSKASQNELGCCGRLTDPPQVLLVFCLCIARISYERWKALRSDVESKSLHNDALYCLTDCNENPNRSDAA